jgi:hypothetical protein
MDNSNLGYNLYIQIATPRLDKFQLSKAFGSEILMDIRNHHRKDSSHC